MCGTGTGLQVSCQREREREKNRFIALRALVDKIELAQTGPPGALDRDPELARRQKQRDRRRRRRAAGRPPVNSRCRSVQPPRRCFLPSAALRNRCAPPLLIRMPRSGGEEDMFSEESEEQAGGETEFTSNVQRAAAPSAPL